MLKNPRQSGILLRKLSRLKRFKRETERLSKNLKPDPKFIEKSIRLIDDDIEKLEAAFQRFSLARNHAVLPSVPDLSQIGQDLVNSRIALGWTQEEVATQFGVTRQQITRYEAHCYAQASFGLVQKISAEFRKELDELQEFYASKLGINAEPQAHLSEIT